jgi:hypothetical protein
MLWQQSFQPLSICLLALHISHDLIKMPRLYNFSAIKVLELLKNDTITVEEYAGSLLQRIRERDSIIKAWAYLGNSSFYVALLSMRWIMLILGQIPNSS